MKMKWCALVAILLLFPTFVPAQSGPCPQELDHDSVVLTHDRTPGPDGDNYYIQNNNDQRVWVAFYACEIDSPEWEYFKPNQKKLLFSSDFYGVIYYHVFADLPSQDCLQDAFRNVSCN